VHNFCFNAVCTYSRPPSSILLGLHVCPDHKAWTARTLRSCAATSRVAARCDGEQLPCPVHNCQSINARTRSACHDSSVSAWRHRLRGDADARARGVTWMRRGGHCCRSSRACRRHCSSCVELGGRLRAALVSANPSEFVASGGVTGSGGAAQQLYGFCGAASAFLTASELCARRRRRASHAMQCNPTVG